MFCNKCGKPIEGDAILCPECAAAQNQETATPVQEPPAFTVASTEPAPKKKKKLGLTLGIIGGIVVVLGIVCALCWGWISSLFEQPAPVPQGNQQNSQSNVVSTGDGGITDLLVVGYDKLINTEIELPNSANLKTNLVISKDVLSLVQPYLPEEIGDISWLSEINLDMDYAIADDKIQYIVGIGLGQQRLLSVKALLDMDAGVAYVSIPELSTTALRVELDDSMMDAVEEMEAAMAQSELPQQILDAVVKSLPDTNTFRTLVNDYTALILETMGEPEKSQTTITVGSDSAEVTANTYTLNAEKVMDIAEAVLTKAQTDTVILQSLSALSTNLAEAYPDADPGDLQAAYTDGIASLLEEIEESREYTDSTQVVLYTTYVDQQNRNVGLKLEMNNGEEVAELAHYHIVYTGTNSYNFELSIPAVSYLGVISLTGSYAVDNGAENLTCVVSVGGTEYVTIMLKDVTSNSGTLRIQPSQMVVDMIMNSADLDMIPTSLLSNIALELRRNGSTYAVDIMSGSKSLLMFKLGIQTSNQTVTAPGSSVDVTDQEALMEWVGKLNFKNVLNNLKNAGIPSTITDALESALEYYLPA